MAYLPLAATKLHQRNSLPTFSETMTEKIIELRLCFDRLHGFFDIVFDASEFDALAVVDYVTATGITIPWLANTANVHHHSLARVTDPVTRSNIAGPHKAKITGKDPGNMGVPLKTNAWHQGEQLLHLFDVLSVLGENVFVGRAPRRAMHKQRIPFIDNTRQSANELHPTPPLLRTVIWRLNSRPRPKDGLLGSQVEPLGIEQSTTVVVPQHAEVELARLVQTFTRRWTIPDHISQANDPVNILPINILQHGLQSRVVAMDIADDGGSCQFGRSAIGAVLLSTMLKSIAEPVGKVGNVIDFVSRSVDFVLNAAEIQRAGIGIEDNVA